jgi:hypothetical protein
MRVSWAGPIRKERVPGHGTDYVREGTLDGKPLTVKADNYSGRTWCVTVVLDGVYHWNRQWVYSEGGYREAIALGVASVKASLDK